MPPDRTSPTDTGTPRRGIRARIVMAVALSVSPLLVLSGYETWTIYDRDRKAAVREAALQCDGVVSSLDAWVRDADMLLTAVEQMLSTNPGDIARNESVLSELKSRLPTTFHTIKAHLPDGTALGSSSGRRNALPVEREYLARAVERRTLAIGEPVISGASGEHTIGIADPVLRPDGSVEAVASISFRLQAIEQIVRDLQVPESAVVLVISEGGRVIHRSPDHEGWTGRDAATHPLILEARATGRGVTRQFGLSNVDRLWSFRTCERAPWIVLLGRTPESIFADSNATLARTVFLSCLTLLAAGALSLLISNRITSPLRRLTGHASRWGAGELSLRTGEVGPDEVGQLGATLNAMAESLDQQRESGRRMSEVFEATSDLVSVTEADGRIVYLNQAGCALLGIDPSEAPGTPITSFYPPAIVALIRNVAIPHAARDGTWRGEIVLLAKDGREIPVSQVVIAHLDEAGHLKFISTIARDISEERRAAEALHESERRAALIVERALDAVVSIDDRSRVIAWNPSAQAVFGWTAQEALGRPLAELLIPEGLRDAHAEGMRRYLGGGPGPLLNRRIEVVGLHKEGRPMPLEMAIMPISTPSGVTFSAFIRDLTEVKRAQELRDGFSRVFERISRGDALESALEEIARIIEQQAPGLRSAVLLKDPDAPLLHISAGPSMPQAFKDLATSLSIGPNQGACGVAAFRGELVISDDIENDPDWASVRDVMLSFEIRSCWSQPIISDRGVLGTVAIYCGTARQPTERELQLLASATSMAALAIERSFSQEALRRSEERHRMLFDVNPQPLWVYDKETLRFLAVNNAAVERYGYSREEFLAMTIKDIRPPEDVPALMAVVTSRSEGINPSGLWRHRRKDGSLLFVEVVSHALEFEGRRAQMVMAADVTERRRAEEALRVSEARYRRLAEHGAIGIWEVQRSGATVYANPEMCRLLEVGSQEDLNGVAFHDVFTPESLDRLSQIFDARRPSHVASCEVEVLGKRGGRRTAVVSGAPIEGSDGRELTLVGTFMDVTELRSAQARLVESEERYRQIVETAREGIWMVDASWRTTFANPRLAEMLGCDAEGMLGRHITEFMDDEGRELASAYMKRRENGESDSYEFKLTRADGSPVWTLISTNPLTDEHGRFTGSLAMLTDITDRRRAEVALRDSERRLRTIIETEPECVKVLSPAGILQHMNRAGLDMLEADSLDQLRGRAVADAVDPEFREAFRRLTASVAAGEQGDLEFSITGLRGTKRWLDTRAAPLRDDQGAIVGVLGITRDVTERVRAREELAQRAQELARSNAELERFAYVASHDLQEPLRMVTSFTQLLAKRYEGKLGPDADEYIGFAVEGAVRMRQLIEDLLSYSRVNTTPRTFGRVSAAMSLARAMANLRTAIEESGGTVTSDDLPELVADGQQLAMVFQNLIANAIKFRSAEPPRVHVSAARRPDHWEFRVRDNGIGIDSRHCERIFTMFQRLHPRTEYPGNGIGLAICKRIVEGHGGRIWVESVVGTGSEFCFTVPDAPRSGSPPQDNEQEAA
jgi:PAS domain S-box-containing protein